MERRKRKADMLKKRTCSHCGKTGPLSRPSFAYCGGCRHPSVARADLPRLLQRRMPARALARGPQTRVARARHKATCKNFCTNRDGVTKRRK